MNIIYRNNFIPNVKEIIEVYESSGINRPTKEKERIAKMYKHSNLIISAWDNKKLVGIARALTDFCYCCYLSDLAVRSDYQKRGIGKELIEEIKKIIKEETALILLSAPTAMDYYPKIGFDSIKNGYIIKRLK
ncbi:MAG: GNAT family N-acetyltransferase [Bacteroidetes bacterium]|nr:GNAT family N-acetyltransferase [Bacteroidota bacterium]